MAKFTQAEWALIEAELDASASEEPYGMPERRDDSVVMASFNIRALGKDKTIEPTKSGGRTKGAWDLLARFCSRCDFVAIQEVKDDLSGLRRLKNDLVDSDKYAIVVSDVAGSNPNTGKGFKERLAFLYRWDKIERTELASDIGFDRSAVVTTLMDNRDAFMADFKAHDDALVKHAEKVDAYNRGERASKPDKPILVLSNFLTFVRTPHVASFRIKGAGSAALPFHAVNAHLLYGSESRSKEERKMEFDALVNWLRWRTKAKERLYHKNIILFGDMNLEFEQRYTSMAAADQAIKDMNLDVGSGFTVNFPFLDVPGKRQNAPTGDGRGRYKSTARETETYDQIGLFGYKKQLPGFTDNDAAASDNAKVFDYNVFTFADVFAKALHGKDTFLDVPNHKKFITRFEHDVSDHHPIWVRLAKPL